MLESLKELPRIVERQIPILTHFQICEGFREVLGETLPNKILDFEKQKFGEL